MTVFDAATRDTTLADAPDTLVAKAFELEPGKAARIPGTAGTSTIAIVQTTEILPPDPDNADLVQQRNRLAADIEAGRLVEVLPQYRSLEMDIHAVYPTRKHVSPKVRLLIDFLVESFRIPRWPA